MANKGDTVRIEITDVSAEGMGIGKTDGFAVFVKEAQLGDIVDVQLTKIKKNYGFGKVVNYISLSDKRIEAGCLYYQECGGCVFQRLSYEGQLYLKRRQTEDKLIRLGGLKNPQIRDIVAMDEPLRYRNKASMPVSTGGLITKKGGATVPVHEPKIGFFRAGSHQVVDCDDCLLQSEPAMAAAAALRKFMEEDNITSYDPRWEKGLMRRMTVRTAFGTGEVMVILEVNGRGIPNASKLITMLDETISLLPPQTAGDGTEIEFSLESVILRVNKGKDSSGGGECITLAGKPTINEKAGGLEFEISPLSFYQVNPVQTEKLYGKVLEYADLKGDETVLDLYCGVGTIGLFCADDMRKKGGEGNVIGIESVKDAVTDANRNAVINGIVNAWYMCGKAEKLMPELVQKGALPENLGNIRINKPDIVILDPPRAGCAVELLDALAEAAPGKIIYVSCDPATLARDIKRLGERGYRFAEATPVDMFPWTSAIEVVSLLLRA